MMLLTESATASGLVPRQKRVWGNSEENADDSSDINEKGRKRGRRLA